MKKRIISLLLTVVMFASLMTTWTATAVSAEDFVLDPDKLLTGDSGLATFTTGASIGGKENVLEVNTTSKTDIRYQGIGMSAATAGTVRYLLVDVYYSKSSATSTPFGINTTFRQVNNKDKWDMYNYQENGSNVYRNVSSGLSALPNRWETIAIDCQNAMNYLSSNNYSLWGMQIALPQASGSDRVYVGDVRFSATTGDFEFGKTSTIMSSSDLMSNPSTTDFSGKTGVQQFEVSSGAHTIRYGGVHMGYAYASSNKYLMVECYLDDDSLEEFSITTVFRSVNNGATWINGNASSTQTSLSYPTKQWVTVAIDCTEPLASLATNKQSLTQIQIAFPATDADLYVNSVRFEGGATVHANASGKYVYLSEDGIVTVGGNTIAAFTNTTEAFTALGVTGGTVYLEGNLTSFTDVANGTRGAIVFRGLGNAYSDVVGNVLYRLEDIEIKGGDITFDYLTVEPFQNAESGINYTSIYTCQSSAPPIKHITIGSNIRGGSLALGSRKGNQDNWANRDVFTINGGTYHAISPVTNYGARRVIRLGTIDWTINRGTIHKLYAGSNNSWEYENSQIRGDVKYTINGGTFDQDELIMGSAYGSTEIQGNIIWTINGGTMSGKTIVGGDAHASKGTKPQTYLQNVAAIVNLKGGKSGLKTLTLGTAGAKGLDINGKEIYILNNYEDNLGTQIAAGSLAEYKIHVYDGKAEPVFANDQTTTVNGSTEYFGGALLGFKLTPDKIGAIPYINGIEVKPNSSGIYEIAENTSGITEISFVKAASKHAIAKVGEYINFGDYNGYDVKYRIVGIEDINEDGTEDYVLASTDIIMFKAADGTNQNMGWANSSIRRWLNSSDNTVSYDGVTAAPEAYVNEAGFMSNVNMNDHERSLVLPVTHKYMYPWDGGKDGGTEEWTWNDGEGKSIKNCLTNYDNARYKLTTDYIFLPTVKELIDYNIALNADAAASAGAESNNGAFYLRDATKGSGKPRYYYKYNYISNCDSSNVQGIRTMLYLDGSAVICGNGTNESPYYIEGGRDGDSIYIKSMEKTSDGWKFNIKNKSQDNLKADLFVGVYSAVSGGALNEIYKQTEDIVSGRTKEYKVKVTDAGSKNLKAFCWREDMMPYSIYVPDMDESRNFVINKDVFLDNPEITIGNSEGSYGVENAFDNDSNTVFRVTDLLNDDMIFSFKYPADITEISFTSHAQKKRDSWYESETHRWLRAKKVDIYAYTDDYVYRNKKSPKLIKTITLADSTNKQTFDLSGDNLEGVTHLIFKTTSAYSVEEGDLVCGGFKEMSITGRQDKNNLSVDKLSNPYLYEHSTIMSELGIGLSQNPKTAEIKNALKKIGITATVYGSDDSYMSAEQLYKNIAAYAGYSDQEFLDLGIATLRGITRLTKKDVEIGICEALMTPIKSSGTRIVRKIWDDKLIEEGTYNRIFDKITVYKDANIGEFSKPDDISAGTNFTLTKNNSGKEIMPTNFAYNMPFHYQGGYLGTLPVDNPDSTRDEFADALSDIGCKALRFPGGAATHQYFIEGEEYVKSLNKQLNSRFGGLYDANSKNSSYCIDFYNFMDFCQETGIEPIFEVNTSFYVDSDDDKIHAITKNRYVADEEGNIRSDATSYYDRDRITEAARELGNRIDEMLANGYSIKYWEIGNEDYSTLNYEKKSTLTTSDTATINYAAIVTAFVNVIKAKIPNAYIIVTGQAFPEKIEDIYSANGVLNKISATSTHYPFSLWRAPKASQRDDLTYFNVNNEVQFATFSTNNTGYRLPICTTETMTYRYELWDESAIQHTFAMALNTADQWGEAVFDTSWDITVMHDLESNYFGYLLYGSKFNPKNRHFVNYDVNTVTDDIPKDYSCENSYFENPAGRALGILSAHTGGKVLTNTVTAENRLISVFASEKDGKITVTVVNKTNSSSNVNLTFSGYSSFPSQSVTVKRMYTDTLAAMLQREYTEDTFQKNVSGNSISYSAHAYSVSQFVINTNN
jgi:hypothetical protein